MKYHTGAIPACQRLGWMTLNVKYAHVAALRYTHRILWHRLEHDKGTC